MSCKKALNKRVNVAQILEHRLGSKELRFGFRKLHKIFALLGPHDNQIEVPFETIRNQSYETI